MLEIKPQGKIIRRIVKTKTGEFVLATFYVVESESGLDVRLLSVKRVQKQARIENCKLKIENYPLYLTGKCPKFSSVISNHHNYSGVVSPFFNKFEFFVSQPTRAPSLNF